MSETTTPAKLQIPPDIWPDLRPSVLPEILEETRALQRELAALQDDLSRLAAWVEEHASAASTAGAYPADERWKPPCAR